MQMMVQTAVNTNSHHCLIKSTNKVGNPLTFLLINTVSVGNLNSELCYFVNEFILRVWVGGESVWC